MFNKSCRQFRFAAIIFAVVFSTACAGNREVAKWKAAAEISQGHSPRTFDKNYEIMEDVKPPPKDGEAQVVETQAQLPSTNVTLNMKGTDIKVVLRALARAAHVNIILRDDLKGEIDVDVVDAPWDQVFKGIIKNNGLFYTYSDSIIQVSTPADLETETKVSALNEKLQNQNAGIKLVEPNVTVYAKIDFADAAKLKETLEPLLPKVTDIKLAPPSSIRVEEHNNALLITTNKELAKKIIEIIKKVDVATSQIRIKANIVETSKDVARNLGIQWGGLYYTKGAGTNMIVTPGGSGITTTTGGTGGTGGTNVTGGSTYTPFVGQPGIAMQGLGINFPATPIGNQAASIGVILGALSGNVLEAQLSALQQDGKLNILSSPSITTLDNQKAFTENGQKVPFVTTQVSGGTSTQTVSFENAMLRLEITPHVINGNILRMAITVTNDDVDLSHNVSGNPFINKKLTQTVLIVKDGETIVISGLKKSKETDTNTGIPLLKDIPFFGFLFGGESKDTSMQEVLIFITPTILPIQSEG